LPSSGLQAWFATWGRASLGPIHVIAGVLGVDSLGGMQGLVHCGSEMAVLVREHENAEQLGARRGTERVDAITKLTLDVFEVHGRNDPKLPA
jgi:hypothetical protein